MNSLKSSFNPVTNHSILLSYQKSIRPFELCEIIKIKADGSYSLFYFTGEQKPLLISRNIGYFEKLLAVHGFYRIHNSCLLNKAFLLSYIPGEHPSVMLKNLEQESISRNKRKDILKLLSI
jgi:two-component system LytT family response regulator